MRTAIAAVIVMSLAAGAAAQKPGPAAVPKPAAPDAYTYESGGRRDPFVNLLGTGADVRPPSNRGGGGAAGLTVGEISVRGVVQSRDGLVALVQGPDNKTYLVHTGDKFVDGTVKSITPQGLVIVQEVNDPLSLVKQREIRKQLRSAEGAK